MGFFRLGFLDSVLSRALLRGFISAVAFVVMIDLSDSLFGFTLQMHALAQGNSPFQHLLKLITSMSSAHLPTLILSVISILFLALVKTIKNTFARKHPKIKLIPEVLFLVVISTALSYYFEWSTFGIKILREAESSLPSFQIPHLSINRINVFFLPAVMISLIGFVESIAVGKTYANKCQYSISPNRELVALGGANLANSFLGGWPAFGSLGRSAVAYAAGIDYNERYYIRR